MSTMWPPPSNGNYRNKYGDDRMANPGKQYEIRCELDMNLEVIGEYLFIQDVIKLGRRHYQINGYGIEVI